MIIAIAGGSGSGKSTLAQQMLAALGSRRAVLISLDAYYLNQHEVPEAVRGNFDHPQGLDDALLAEHLAALQAGHAIDLPCYDFTTHTRLQQTERVAPRDIMLLDGVLVMAMTAAQPYIDHSVYVDAPADIRLARRLLRDVQERGRTAESVVIQYLTTVRPMHDQFVAPYQQQADHCVDNEAGFKPDAVDLLRALRLYSEHRDE